MTIFQCCLLTPDPGPWKAGVDDSADPEMIARMHSITGRLSYAMPLDDFIWALRAAVNIDSRTRLGRDIQRCLLSNAVHRLEVLGRQIDRDTCWRPWRMRLKDAWAVWQRRAAVTYIKE